MGKPMVKTTRSYCIADSCTTLIQTKNFKEFESKVQLYISVMRDSEKTNSYCFFTEDKSEKDIETDKANRAHMKLVKEEK